MKAKACFDALGETRSDDSHYFLPYLYQLVDHRNLIKILLHKITAAIRFLEIQPQFSKTNDRWFVRSQMLESGHQVCVQSSTILLTLDYLHKESKLGFYTASFLDLFYFFQPEQNNDMLFFGLMTSILSLTFNGLTGDVKAVFVDILWEKTSTINQKYAKTPFANVNPLIEVFLISSLNFNFFFSIGYLKSTLFKL